VQKLDHNIGFWEKRNFFRRKLSKIAENCDHNIDPWPAPHVGEKCSRGRSVVTPLYLYIVVVLIRIRKYRLKNGRIWWLFTNGSFLNTEVGHNLRLLFSTVKTVHLNSQKWVWLQLGRFFHKLIWSPRFSSTHLRCKRREERWPIIFHSSSPLRHSPLHSPLGANFTPIPRGKR
jgi:hypothetical protein